MIKSLIQNVRLFLYIRIMQDYQLIRIIPKTGQAKIGCISHKEIPVLHLFGNTNWVFTQIDDTHISFTCMVCGEIREYRRLTERTLL